MTLFKRTMKSNKIGYIYVHCAIFYHYIFSLKSSFLKELRNHDGKLFLGLPQNRRKHNQHFKLLFFKLNPHPGTPSQTVFFWSSLLQKCKVPTKVHYKFFLFCLKRNNSQTFKNSSCEKPFLQCLCYRYNLLP